jgi:hypothetical protein
MLKALGRSSMAKRYGPHDPTEARMLADSLRAMDA